MSRKRAWSHRVFLAVGFTAVLTLPLQIVLLERVADGPHSIAASWVNSLDEADLNALAVRLDRIPIEFRRLAARRMTPATQAAALRASVDRFLAATPGLDRRQADAVMRVAALAVPETFDGQEAARIALRDAGEAVRTGLGTAAHERIFLTADPTAADGLPYVTRFRLFVERRLTASARMTECNCNHMFGSGSNIDCTGSLSFCSELQGCEYTIWGCGGQFPWNYNCDAYCIQPPL